MALHMITIRRNGDSVGITIPVEIMRAMNWTQGTKIVLEATGDDLLKIHGERRIKKMFEESRAEREAKHGTTK